MQGELDRKRRYFFGDGGKKQIFLMHGQEDEVALSDGP
jgi:hypothetical protein